VEGCRSWSLDFDQERSRTCSVQASLGTLREPFVPCCVTLDWRALMGWTYDRATTALRVRAMTTDGTLAVTRARPSV